jgi:hypothetical protein
LEDLYRVRGKKAEGEGKSQTRNKGKGPRPIGSLEAGYTEGSWVRSREKRKRRNGPGKYRAPNFKTTPTSSSLPSTPQISHMFLRNVT